MDERRDSVLVDHLSASAFVLYAHCPHESGHQRYPPDTGGEWPPGPGVAPDDGHRLVFRAVIENGCDLGQRILVLAVMGGIEDVGGEPPCETSALVRACQAAQRNSSPRPSCWATTRSLDGRRSLR